MTRCYCGRFSRLRTELAQPGQPLPPEAIMCQRCIDRREREDKEDTEQLLMLAERAGWPAVPKEAMTGATSGGPSNWRRMIAGLNSLGRVYLINRLKNGVIPPATPPITDAAAADGSLWFVRPSPILAATERSGRIEYLHNEAMT